MQIDRFLNFQAGRDDPELRAELDDPGSEASRVREAIRGLARSTRVERALLATISTLRKCGDEARHFAIQRLKELVAENSHRFWAPRAWLFLKDGDALRAVVRRKTSRTDATIPLDERSIVTWVARTGEAYYTNDAPNDPNF